MPKGKIKKAVKVVKKIAIPEPKAKVIVSKPVDLQKKYDELVNDIVSSNLLTNEQLKTGGEAIRQRYTHEVSGFTPILNELNLLGKKLGKPEIGLGSLRK